VATIVPTETTAHVEGHLVVVASHRAAAPSALAPVVDLGSQRAQTLLRLGDRHPGRGRPDRPAGAPAAPRWPAL